MYHRHDVVIQRKIIKQQSMSRQGFCRVWLCHLKIINGDNQFGPAALFDRFTEHRGRTAVIRAALNDMPFDRLGAVETEGNFV